MPISTQQQSQLASEGISLVHAESFLEVSKSQDCVILTRSPGEACFALLAEGHDAKGFHIKGKSCDWGPMAGFLCAEPLFNKSGGKGAVSNARAHRASLTHKFEGKSSQLVALELSDARARWVAERAKLKLTGDVLTGETDIPNTEPRLKLKWALLRDSKTGRWKVFHDPTGLAAATRALTVDPEQLATLDAYRTQLDAAAGPSPASHPGYKPVLALTNPHLQFTRPEDSHKNAVTGDFDLFAVWPRAGRDAEFRVRVGGMKQADTTAQKDAQKDAIYTAEAGNAIGSVVGNISDGLYNIGGLLNSVMAAKTGQASVNRIFHSDEGGRPGMHEVDSSVGFTPDGRVLFFAADLVPFARFALECATTKPTPFVVFLNAGWLAPLKAAAPAEAATLEKLVGWQQGLADVAPTTPQKAK